MDDTKRLACCTVVGRFVQLGKSYLLAAEHPTVEVPGASFVVRVHQPNMPEIVADRERILQVMMNIVSNSIKYTPNGGTIQIYAGHKDETVWMVVVDNGIGIPEKDRPRIFERFYRVDKARSRQSGGTGLGLSIAREIITKHEGSLELVDKEGPGLAVRMELKVEGPSHG